VSARHCQQKNDCLQGLEGGDFSSVTMVPRRAAFVVVVGVGFGGRGGGGGVFWGGGGGGGGGGHPQKSI